ncbi:transcription antiterminator [Enterococcus sp. 669A]|uniref:Transcription antiterminator n=1 Tax=Candidatus Enterococcus moelleringii TaxID=2815325 RepID=A0ABS3LEV4_9ENTE|nr:BglG family transcription antiterminator [Enterococcus sp. 669A]MBO1308168.1 transcription antiterminator [Enterococcus sp. 669A]
MEGMNTRQKKLISLLVQNDEYLPVVHYAKLLGKTNRTIYSDLEKIQANCLDAQLLIDKKPRIGVKLVGEASAKMQLLEALDQPCEDNSESTPFDRQLLIAKMLLVDEQTVTQQKLSDQFHVSASSIASDLEKINETYAVQVVASKKGTWIEGSEEERQRSLFRLSENLLIFKGITNEQLFLENGFQALQTIFDPAIVSAVFQQVQLLKQNPTVFVSEQYEKSLTIRLIIFLERLKRQQHVEEDEFLFDQIKMIDTYFLASEFLSTVTKQLNIPYQEDDVAYVNRQLVGYGVKIHSDQQQALTDFAPIIDKVLKNMSEIMQVDFMRDEELKQRFINHFIPMIYRLKLGIEITNPLVEEIKNQYSIIFSSTWYALSNIEHELKVQFNDEEVAFLAMYFQVSLEKSQNGKKILIVCPTGVGTSELIYHKIKRILPAQDIAEVTTIDKLYKKNLDNVDLIISSIHLPEINKPIIKVSTLVTQEDIKNITSLYSDFFYQEEDTTSLTMEFHSLKEVIDEDYIETEKQFENKTDCLNYMIDRLEKGKIVDKAFRQEVFEREQLGETALETGVAIPHAAPQNVLKTKVFILTLEKPIVWDQRKVSYVLLMCVAKCDRSLVRGIITDMHKIVRSEVNIKHFFFKKNAHEIYQEISRR